MSVFVFALKYGLFMLRFMHLCVWPRGQLAAGRGGSVVSGHAWIVALFSSIVLSQQQSVCRSRKHLSLLRHIKEDGHLLCFTAQGYHKVNTIIYSFTPSSALALFASDDLIDQKWTCQSCQLVEMTLNFKCSCVYKPCDVRSISWIDILDHSSAAAFAVPPFLIKYWSVGPVICNEIGYVHSWSPEDES